MEQERSAIAITPQVLFQDSEAFNLEALKLLEAGDVRDAAEKAWGAMVNAVRALVVARGYERPDTSTGAGLALDALTDRDPRLENLNTRYHVAKSRLHGDCFYDGVCARADRRIRLTAEFIAEARKMARR